MNTCRICGVKDVPRETFAQIRYFRCSNCNTAQLEELPTLEELKTYYARYSDEYTAGMSRERFGVEIPKRHAAKLRLMRQYVATGSLLDVGCGEGWFLGMADGYERVGCDFSVATAYPTGVHVVQGTLDEPGGLPFPDKSFDAVTFWAVIEHVRDPHAALDEIYRVLKPGGYMFCDTPLCSDDAEMNVAARSHWFFPPEHIHVFSHRALIEAISAAEFSVVLSIPSFERSLPRYVARRARNILVGSVCGRAVRAITPRKWAHMRQSRVTQIGDIQLVVAQKGR